MKKKVLLIILIVLIVLSFLVTIILKQNNKPFYLEDSYYGINNVTEINVDELNELINNKKSFAVFVYQPMCITSCDFEKVLDEFLEEEKISIYKIAFSDIKDTEIGKSVKFYPSFIIYNNGNMIDFLESNKDEDVNYYTSKEGFKKWFTKYVKLKNDINEELN